MSINLKSSVKRVKELDFSKKIIIKELVGRQEIVALKYNQLKRDFPNLPKEEIWKQIDNIVLKDAIFSKAISLVLKSYELNILDDDVTMIANFYINNVPSFAKTSFERAKWFARNSLVSELILLDLSKYWNITATEQEAIEVFNRMYYASKGTISVNEQIKNKVLLGKIRDEIIRHKTADMLISKVKYTVDWKAIHEDIEKSRKTTKNEN